MPGLVRLSRRARSRARVFQVDASDAGCGRRIHGVRSVAALTGGWSANLRMSEFCVVLASRRRRTRSMWYRCSGPRRIGTSTAAGSSRLRMRPWRVRRRSVLHVREAGTGRGQRSTGDGHAAGRVDTPRTSGRWFVALDAAHRGYQCRGRSQPVNNLISHSARLSATADIRSMSLPTGIRSVAVRLKSAPPRPAAVPSRRSSPCVAGLDWSSVAIE